MKKHLEMPKSPDARRRSFLKTLGMSGGSILLSSFAGRRAIGSPILESRRDSQRELMMLLHSSGKKSVNDGFVKNCRAYLTTPTHWSEKRDLNHTVARICHYNQVYFKDVKDAEHWLEQNGYLHSLDYYVSNGGHRVLIFHDLDRISEPQYGIDQRSLAYIGYALRTRYTKGPKRYLSLMFPGPSERLGPNGFYRYFARYDFLAEGKRPLTFGEVYDESVDHLLFGNTMLNHGGRGIFDAIALRSSDNATHLFGSTAPAKWVKANVDDRVFLYRAELRGAGKCWIDRESAQWADYVAGKALAPYKYEESCYRILA